MKKCIAILMAFIMTIFLVSPVLTAPSRWAAEAVEEAIYLGLVPTNLQSNFQMPTTRAEFAALAVALYEYHHGTIFGRVSFTDTNDTAVEKAAYIGIVSGVGGGRFNPDGILTREQAAVLVHRLLNTMGLFLPLMSSTFADESDIASWARLEVGAVQDAGIMGGVSNNMFSPRGIYTREQSIVTMMRMYEKLATIREEAYLSFMDAGITDSELAIMVDNGTIPADVTRLNIMNNYITDISPLIQLVYLESLNLGINKINDISPLSHLTRLQTLGLSINNISDISPLENLVNLHTLGLSYNEISDISYLRNLTELFVLAIDHNPIIDISPISHLTSLATLWVGDEYYFNGDISSLYDLTDLAVLFLPFLGKTNDFSPIANLNNLQFLELYNAYHLVDLSIIDNHSNLQLLQISGANIQDFSPLWRHTNLRILALSDSSISDIASLNLKYLPSLLSLQLSHNEIEDISVLGYLHRLTHLYLFDNKIVDVSPLGRLTNLQVIMLERNHIYDITPLASLRNLEFISLCDNYISQTQINLLQNALPNTLISSGEQN